MTYHSAPGILKLSNRPMEDIASSIGGYYGVTIDEMKSERRDKPIVAARQIAMYFMKHSGRYTLKNIGLFFGGRDHTTVIHSINQVNNYIATEPEFKDFIEKLKGFSYVRYIPPRIDEAIKVAVMNTKRPPATYSNKSPMGVADEFK